MSNNDLMRQGLTQYFDAHQFPDTDNSASAIHHTLGLSGDQAARGNHAHTFPIAKIYRAAARNIANAAWAIVVMDTNSFHSPKHFTKSDNGLQVKNDGFYLILNVARFDNNNTGQRGIRYTINGTNRNDKLVNTTTVFQTNFENIAIEQLVAGDVIKQEVYQNSGGLLAMNVGGENQTYLFMMYLGETPIDFIIGGAW